MLCDAPFKQIVDHRFSLKGLTWLLLWFLSLSWINVVCAGAIESNTEVKPFTHGTVVEPASVGIMVGTGRKLGVVKSPRLSESVAKNRKTISLTQVGSRDQQTV